MRRIVVLLAIGLLFTVPTPAQVSAPDAVIAAWMQNGGQPYKGYQRGWALISAQELKQRLDEQSAWDTRKAPPGGSVPARNPKVVVVDVAHPQGQYMLDGHIPGAINIWRPDYESPEKLFGMRGENLMNRSDFQGFLRSLGIDDDSMVVWTDHNYDSTRLWWACKLYGFDTRVLDGGIKAWKAAGFEIDRFDSPKRPGGGTVTLAEGQAYVRVGADAVWKCKDDPQWVLWDIRSKDEWSGERKRTRRGGHIPWQKGTWYSWKDVHRADGTFLDAAELTAYTMKIGMSPFHHNVFYCQSGVRVTQTFFALFLQGWPLEQLHIFDSSWIGWGNSPDYPVVDGEGKPVVGEDARPIEIKD